MAPISQPTFTPPAAEVTIVDAEKQKITNLTLLLANTEYAHALQTKIKQLRIKARDNSVLKYSSTLGESGTIFWTIPKGCVEDLTNLTMSGFVYIQSNTANTIVEIMELL